MPPYLKDPENYDKIQRALLEALASKHQHSEIQDWSKCKKCQDQAREHFMLMRKLGFKTGAQYRSWKKIMEQIKSSDNLRHIK